jgi:DNA modification methylase
MVSPHCAESVQPWPIEKLIPFAMNARTHSDEQVAQVAASIAEFGFVNPILAGEDGVLIAGHARLLAARKLKLQQVPVIVLRHLSETQRRALVIADNRLALNAGWDEELLRLELTRLAAEDFDTRLLGFDDLELAHLMEAHEAAPGLTDADSVPELPQKPVSRVGDLWLLGPHRVLCGDALVSEHVRHLMQSDYADLVFTDPPYNVDYEGYTAEKLTIQNDRQSPEQYRQFLLEAFLGCRRIVKPGASFYVCHPSVWQREFQDAIEAAGLAVRCQIIWAKNTFAWGFGRYKFQHEPIFYCYVSGQSDVWYGDKSQSTLWLEDKPAANRLHPTMKPVELVERALSNSSKAGDIVVDLFGGSGSTLIGCERMGRRARLMEIDLGYADVIVKRWQEYTGKAGTLEGDERTFAEMDETRRQEAT